jgi:hypothetical protein
MKSRLAMDVRVFIEMILSAGPGSFRSIGAFIDPSRLQDSGTGNA